MYCTYLSESLLVHHDSSLEEGAGAQGQIHLVRKLDATNGLSSSSDDPASGVSTTGIITTIDALCQLARREGDDTVEVVLTGPDRDVYDRFDPKVDAYLTDPSHSPSPSVSRIRLTLGEARVFCMAVLEDGIRQCLDDLSWDPDETGGPSLHARIQGLDGILASCAVLAPPASTRRSPGP